MLNLDEYRANCHPGAPWPQDIGKPPKVTDNDIRSFESMRIYRKKESMDGSDWGSGTLVYYRLCIYSFPVSFRPYPRVLKVAMKRRGSTTEEGPVRVSNGWRISLSYLPAVNL